MHRTRPIIHTWPQIAPWPNLTLGYGICNRVFSVLGVLYSAIEGVFWSWRVLSRRWAVRGYEFLRALPFPARGES